MPKQIAKFNDGTVKEIKNSRRTYVYAWRWKCQDAQGVTHSNTGFSSQNRISCEKVALADYRFHAAWAAKDGRPVFDICIIEIATVREG